ncbi:conserved hypothetical protein [Uncinocarpus reesii 1704]|uniref:Senescence domain-containing protein n=1 Tax=Uncinocarpus reesii (strain UAMH 1704) TaxID=336963 RepID=C4JY65_UNCRE|nr:uncharacterized protein UREG_07116 [Uncinocarpus reesii 1704]EEP82251.1 conserved hypothetical protein [Uncinocarpus reesii 1704]
MNQAVNDPRLCFSIDNIRAFHLQNGEESELTTSGPQTLSLLMVPTSSPSPDPNNPQCTEEDFYLHLHLPPELELPLPATTQIYHQPPNSYLIPRWDLGPEAGAFTRIQFPPVGTGPGTVSQEDVDTFETILAQCTAFLERSVPPNYHEPYNPATFGSGEGYVGSGKEKQKPGHGQIVLVDEENGSVVGELSQGFNLTESPDVKPGSKDPVQIELPGHGEGNQINVSNAPPEYLRLASHPVYAKSTLVQNAAAASRLLVTTSLQISNALQSGADSFTKKTKPNAKPMTFSPTTQAHIRRINTISSSAASLSAKTVGQIGKYAQNIGASMSRKGERDTRPKGFDKDGKPIYNYKPGILNKSLIAFSTLGDGIEQSARNLLESGSLAATTVVGHKYGDEARAATSHLTGGVKNVGLVYIDASGVSRRAILKSVAKGMLVGRMHDGQQGHCPGAVMAGRFPSGIDLSGQGQKPGSGNLSTGALNYPRVPSPSPTPPPAYGARGGVSLGGTPMQGSKR